MSDDTKTHVNNKKKKKHILDTVFIILIKFDTNVPKLLQAQPKQNASQSWIICNKRGFLLCDGPFYLEFTCTARLRCLMFHCASITPHQITYSCRTGLFSDRFPTIKAQRLLSPLMWWQNDRTCKPGFEFFCQHVLQLEKSACFGSICLRLTPELLLFTLGCRECPVSGWSADCKCVCLQQVA